MVINKRKEFLVAMAMLAPNLIGLIVFMVIPAVASIGISFTNWTMLNSPTFIGLDNYKELIHDSLFWYTLKNTAVYVFWKVPVNIFISLAFAVLLNKKMYGRSIFRSIFFLPMVASSVSVALLWQPLFETNNGVLNVMLRAIGLKGLPWIYSQETAMMSVILVALWKEIGYYMVMFLAGLQSIPATYYEAAEIDGSSPLRTFFKITVPLISPTTFFVFIISVIGSFQIFDLTSVLTAGGPANSTYTTIMYVYKAGFNFFRMGYASAISTILFLIILVLTTIQNKLSSAWVYY